MKKKGKGIYLFFILAVILFFLSFFIFFEARLSGKAVYITQYPPINHWNFEGNANDIVGLNHGTVFEASISNGISGQSYSFDGVNDYIKMVQTDKFDGFQKGSVSAWIKCGNVCPIGAILAYSSKSSSSSNYVLRINENTLEATWNPAGSTSWNSIKASKLVNDDKWHHVVFSAAGNTRVKIFLDGSELSTTFSKSSGKGSESDWFADLNSVSTSGHHISIGVIDRSSAANWFKGSIDDVKIWDYALTYEEIKKEYESLTKIDSCLVCPDLNNDGEISIVDQNLFENCVYFGKECDNYNFDLNGDGMITIVGDSPCIGENMEKSTSDVNQCKLTLSMATLKDEYDLKDYLKLTDPPEIETSASNEEIVNSSNFTVSPSYDGYIVEFEATSLLEKKEEIEKEINKSNPKSSVATKQKILRDRLRTYSNDVEKEKQDLKKRISSKVSVIRSITGKATSTNLEFEREYSLVLNGVYINISDEEAKEISTIEGVKNVFPNYKVSASLFNSVRAIGAKNVWELDSTGDSCAITKKPCLTGKDVTLGVIDTGIDYTHPDLGGCIGTNCKVIGGWDFVNNDNDPKDDNGHGTHCAGIAAGNGVLKGVAPDAKLYAYKVLDSTGQGNWDDVIAAIELAVDPNRDKSSSDHLDVISLSLGSQCLEYGSDCGPDDIVSKAIDNAVKQGVVAVVASGNSGPGSSTISTPGTARKAITVGATDSYSVLADFSSRGPIEWINESGKKEIIIKPDLVAPGVSICSAKSDSYSDESKCLDDDHIAISGTSMATPHVAGAAALLLQKNSSMTPDQVKSVLKANSEFIGKSQQYSGSGRINIYKAIKNGISKDYFEVAILSPSELQWYSKEQIEIKAIYPTNFNSLEIKYSSEEEPNKWISDGLVKKISGSTVGFLDANKITKPGYYNINVSVVKNGKKMEDVLKVYIDNTLHPGFPAKLNGFSGAGQIPTIADINNDGSDEIILRGINLTVLSGNGKIIWSKPIGLFPMVTTLSSRPASVGDIDNDGEMEIVLSTPQMKYGQKDIYGNPLWYCVYAFEADGSFVEGWPKRCSEDPNKNELSGSLSNTVLTDLNNDGFMEIILTTGAYKVYAFNYKGEKLKWDDIPTTGRNLLGSFGPEVSGDLDNDGTNEVVVTSSNCSPDCNSFITVFDAEGKVIQDIKIRPQGGAFPPALADLDGDKDLEIILNVGTGISIYHHNGTEMVFLSGGGCGPLAIGDFEEDNSPEIVYGECNGNVIIRISDKKGDRSGWPLSSPYIMWSHPVIGQVNGDKTEDIAFVTRGGQLFVYDKDKQKIMEKPSTGNWNWHGGAALGDIDGDGKLELVTMHFDTVFAWDTEGTKSNLSWPQYQHDAQHTGNFNFVKTTPRPQSKIVNNLDTNVTGKLIIKLQKNVNGAWNDEKIIINQLVWIPPKELLKLDSGMDSLGNKIFSGFNSKKVVTTSSGNYRIYVNFNSKEKILESSWKFNVI